jgi:hypothetical protein
MLEVQPYKIIPGFPVSNARKRDPVTRVFHGKKNGLFFPVSDDPDPAGGVKRYTIT